MKRQTSVLAKCPFYKCEERHEIFCSGPRARTSMHMAFAIPTEKKEYLNEHCKNEMKCSECLIYQILEKAGIEE